MDYDTKLTKELIQEAVTRLQKIGYHVAAFVTDLHTFNVSCMNGMGVSIDRPYFCNKNDETHKVFVFADTPHLIKRFRSNFIKNGITLDEEKSYITKAPLLELLKIKSHSTLKVTFKLTRDMLFATSLSAQKVRYATKLFSRTNAKALKRAGELGEIKDQYWKKLSDIMNLINNWFDVFNSKVSRIDSRPRMAAFGLELKCQMKILRKMKKLINNISFGTKVTKRLYPFQEGVLRNLRALPQLHNYLHSKFGHQ